MSKYFNNENIFQINYNHLKNKLNSKNKMIKNYCLNKSNAESIHFDEFIGELNNEEYINVLKLFLEKVNNYDFYKIILASTKLFSRIKHLPKPEDQYFYLILSSEIGYYNIKGGDMSKTKKFRDFYIQNLSRENKIMLISTFRNRHINRYVTENDLNEYKSNNKKRPKETKIDTYVPNCYQKKTCRFLDEYCTEYEPYFCRLSDTELNDKLIDILNYYYDKRSNFVHSGIYFELCGSIFDTYVQNNEIKNVNLTLSLNTFLECYYDALINQINYVMNL